jgi:hypothetical protein
MSDILPWVFIFGFFVLVGFGAGVEYERWRRRR